ncbi:adenosylcobinamide-GDP ribazoletransferase [Variovorax terrae]|uniref:Adenosylcobinamide-GDP ribazoletransferase n=1 Tax=Variovorax terrae TaxID=2923278 RepID=A0A9X2AP15_9BURK|nr:adenosylcobinamide-GDP ribazoletransferase [Variovorax terrae]MCJ0764944.1 adenosylcobinamide-GDP ribazoletransferase [Variovorax terrae]
MNFIRHYLLAVQFFTRIPITGRLAQWTGFSTAMLRASAAHFPGVGWLVGGVAAGVYALVFMALPDTLFTPLVAAVLSTVASVLLTGGFHEDGLADVADGLGGSADRQRALEIMKDSRVGAFGAMALMLALLAKVSLLAMLGASDLLLACAALLAGHVLSRGLPLVLIRVLPHVGDAASSKSKPLADQISGPALAAAFLWCFGAMVLVAWTLDATFFIAGGACAGLALFWMGRLFERRLQGFTGDALGATQQVCEIAFYLGAAFAAV